MSCLSHHWLRSSSLGEQIKAMTRERNRRQPDVGCKGIDRIDTSAPDEESTTVHHQTWRQSQICFVAKFFVATLARLTTTQRRHPSYPYTFHPGIFRLSILETRETSIVEGAQSIGETKKKKSQHHHHHQSCGRLRTIRLIPGWTIEQSTTLGGITERSMTIIMPTMRMIFVQPPLTMPFKNSSRRPP